MVAPAATITFQLIRGHTSQRRAPAKVRYGQLGTVLIQGIGDTILIKKLEPPKRSLSETAAYYLMAFFLPPLAVGLLKGGNTQMGISLFLSFMGWIPGMVHAATLVHDQNRPKIVYRRIPASDIGLLSALQGYHFSEAEGGDGASLYEREYLPVLTKAGQRW